MSNGLTNQLHVTIRQQPVGQGGLCHGQLKVATQRLNWVYDCGSNQTDVLAAEIDRLPPHIDLLFLSHLDDDHVSGIDRLLSQRTIDEIVLPYLNDATRVLLVASATARARLSGALVDLLEDPVAWFTARGVQRVTFINWPSENDGEPEESPLLPLTPDGPLIHTLSTKWTRPPQRQSSSGNAERVPADAALIAVGSRRGSGRSVLDYVFMPHVHPPRSALMKAFSVAIAKRFSSMTHAQIVQSARTAHGRTSLRECFDAIWSDHNLISMSLYTGPTGRGSAWESSDIFPPPWWTEQLASGWISTGDASFQAEVRRRQFARRYAAISDQVGVFVSPHHGAATSWHSAVLDPFVKLHVGLASAGPNGYGHPHSDVISDFVRAGLRFHQVSESPQTLYQLTSRSS